MDELSYFLVIPKLENYVPFITLLVLGDKGKLTFFKLEPP